MVRIDDGDDFFEGVGLSEWCMGYLMYLGHNLSLVLLR